jgi:hypothetical protein
MRIHREAPFGSTSALMIRGLDENSKIKLFKGFDDADKSILLLDTAKGYMFRMSSRKYEACTYFVPHVVHVCFNMGVYYLRGSMILTN